MEWVLLFAIVCGFSSLSSQIKKLSEDKSKEKRTFPSLQNLVGKNIEIEDDEHYYDTESKGILKYYDETWIAIESINKKNQKEINYFRIANISSINIKDK